MNDATAGDLSARPDDENPVPSLQDVIPAYLPPESPPTSVSVIGSGFISSTVIDVNGTSRMTVYVSSTQVNVFLTGNDLSTAGNLTLVAVNPPPGGGSSNALYFVVGSQPLTPQIASVTPTQFYVGSAAMLCVSGQNFSPSSIVEWNGTALATTYDYCGASGQLSLQATVPVTLVSAAGTASVTVENPGASQPISNAVTVKILSPPAPVLSGVSPAAGPIGVTTEVTLTGSGFTSTSAAQFNGTALATNFVSATTLTAALPAQSAALPGNGAFTVMTPKPGGGTSAALNYTAYIGIPNNGMVFDPLNGLFYVSVPGAAGSQYGNSIVSVDPDSGVLGKPVFVGSEPDQMAITPDGKYLWVGLDGASAVRQVNLTTGTAGLEFALGGNNGTGAAPGNALAMAAIPGQDNSVVVATSNQASGIDLAIYDSGVMRGAAVAGRGKVYAIAVNALKDEIYAAAGSSYDVYSYGAKGMTLKTSHTGGPYTFSVSEMEFADGSVYTDAGGVYNAETGARLGTFDASGTTPARGPTFADTTLGKAFVLDGGEPVAPAQVQIFNTTTFTLEPKQTMPVSLAPANSPVAGAGAFPSALTRWGTDGIAFRASTGVYSLRSNSVRNLADVLADVSVQLGVSGSHQTGGLTTYTATVTNAGPATSTNLAFQASVPATGVLVSVTPSTGNCSKGAVAACDLGTLDKGAKTTVALIVKQLSAGTALLTAQANGSETDPKPANNTASATATITGAGFNAVPLIGSISPAAIPAGSGETEISITGTGFAPDASIFANTDRLATTYASSTQLTAIVPAEQLAALGWESIEVVNPGPGGGASNPSPLTVFGVIDLPANRILYDPYSRNIMASLSAGSTQVAGNSLVAIAPETATIGKAVAIGSKPTKMALSDDGQVLYAILSGSQSVARFNMLSRTLEYSYPVPRPDAQFATALRDVATQSGSEDTIALDLGADTGNAIYDFNPAKKTAAIRGRPTGTYTGSCLQFLDAGTLLSFDIDTTGATLNAFAVTPTGISDTIEESTLDGFGCFKLNSGLAFADQGGVANPATDPATQLGVFQQPPNGGFVAGQGFAPDTSLQREFFMYAPPAITPATALAVYDTNSFLSSLDLLVDLRGIEEADPMFVDLVRWGQDGLAALTSSGHIYLLRGPVVVPGLLKTNPAATLTSSSMTTLRHGIGNTLLTLTGAHFLPGVAVNWNGSYRTTTIVDAAHLAVAIPASDLAAPGTASLTAVNPGAPASAALKIAIK